MRTFSSLLRNARGSATVEFALISLFLFGTISVALDFGVYARQKLTLGSAVEQAAIVAYNTQVDSDTTPISAYVRAASGTSHTPTVAITCNGTTTCGDGKCSCLTATGGFSIVGSCNSSCSSVGSNALSGNYMKIVASAAYSSIVVPNRWLGGTTMTQSAVVRLQ